MSSFINYLASGEMPIPCFATPETHNTPRAASRIGGLAFSKIAYMINKLLPLPLFLHSGFEIGERLPINTGLGFEDIDTTKFTSDVLPLFSSGSFDWSGETELIDFIINVNNVIDKYLPSDEDYVINLIEEVVDEKIEVEGKERKSSPDTIPAKQIVSFEMNSSKKDAKLVFIANYDSQGTTFDLPIESADRVSILLGSGILTTRKNKVELGLEKFSFVLLLKELRN